MKSKIFAAVFALLLAVLAVANIAAPKKEFSDNENRSLAVFPHLTAETLRDGSFTKDFSQYVADHFIFRDLWVSIKALSERGLLRMENNGVYAGEDGYLIDSFDAADDFSDNLSAVAQFERDMESGNSILVKTIIAPTATGILEDKLPFAALTVDSEELLAEAEGQLSGFVSLWQDFSERQNEGLYYKTDHHWTYLGAYYAYTAYMNALGREAKSLESFDIQQVTHEFYGTTYSRYGLFYGVEADTISAPSEKALGALTVTDSKGGTTASIYSGESLEGKDKYLYFLGGNDSLLTIDTEVKNGKTLLLIKDSYANAFLPYIVGEFQRIIVVDMRYYLGIVPELVKDENVTDILILYNLKSFSEDKYIEFINSQD